MREQAFKFCVNDDQLIFWRKFFEVCNCLVIGIIIFSTFRTFGFCLLSTGG